MGSGGAVGPTSGRPAMVSPEGTGQRGADVRHRRRPPGAGDFIRPQQAAVGRGVQFAEQIGAEGQVKSPSVGVHSQRRGVVPPAPEVNVKR